MKVIEVYDSKIDISYPERILVSCCKRIPFSAITRSGKTGLYTKHRNIRVKDLKEKDLRLTHLVIVGEKPLILFYKVILRGLKFYDVFILTKRRIYQIKF